MVSKFLNCSILACCEETKLNQKNCERSDGRNLAFLDEYFIGRNELAASYLNSLQKKKSKVVRMDCCLRRAPAPI
ncbi:hypothetical protein WN55_00163 [Dufourea novaeangliae]|uniref:Uncharacterized protein n=1 Tax=Dufourea novaeangliae TaxID=178035 RepID=A0A154PCD6_DUFNO|nr:hypothetical protein WN55_00163 [Dufourea novaeangliae]